MAILSYKYRLRPNRTQAAALEAMLGDFCALYNAGLQQRIEAYRRRGISLAYAVQAAELKAVRAVHDGLARWSFSAEQQVLRRLDKTFRAFFDRIRRGDKAGYPRFRAASRFHTADFRVGDGMTLRKSGRISVVGIPGEIKVKWHRSLPSDSSSAILMRQGGKRYVVLHVEVDAAEPRVGESIGLDVGLTALVALSNGETVARPNWTKRAAKGLRVRQRALARCQRGSKRHMKAKARLAAYSRKVANRRRDMAHKLSADLVSRFSQIAVEGLNIRGLARGMLAREVHDAAWAQMIAMIDYKAAKAGGEIIRIDPRGTSQTCPACGIVKPKALRERTHRCECGCTLDRDVAAAMVVHMRAFPPGTGGRTPSQRVAA